MVNIRYNLKWNCDIPLGKNDYNFGKDKERNLQKRKGRVCMCARARARVCV